MNLPFQKGYSLKRTFRTIVNSSQIDFQNIKLEKNLTSQIAPLWINLFENCKIGLLWVSYSTRTGIVFLSIASVLSESPLRVPSNTHTLFLSHSTHTQTHSLSLTHTHTHTFTHILSLSLTYSLTHSHSFSSLLF